MPFLLAPLTRRLSSALVRDDLEIVALNGADVPAKEITTRKDKGLPPAGHSTSALWAAVGLHKDT